MVGALVKATADLPPSANLDATDGTVTWKSNTDFSLSLQSMDVGFAGTSDRLRGLEHRRAALHAAVSLTAAGRAG